MAIDPEVAQALQALNNKIDNKFEQLTDRLNNLTSSAQTLQVDFTQALSVIENRFQAIRNEAQDLKRTLELGNRALKRSLQLAKRKK